MEFLNNLLESSTMPILGLLTAISPCPLATNVAAVGYISMDIDNRKKILAKGILYTVGRILAYSILGFILLALLKAGNSLFGIQKFVAKYGERIIGPALVLIGLFMLFGKYINLPSFGFKGDGEKWANRGGWGALLLGVLFALAFCPSSTVFYFGMLIPLAFTTKAGFLLPFVFAFATALPVLVIAWIMAFGMNKIGDFYGKMQQIQKWLNLVIGILFNVIGVYYCITVFIL